MNRHLTEEQIAEWVIGERNPAMVQHVAECAACHGQVSDLGQTLTMFRESMHEWGAQQQRLAASPTIVPIQRQSAGMHPLRWAAAAAAVVVMVSVPTYRIRVVEQQKKVEQAKQDAALLQQVDDEVSRTVPDAMEPLTKLIAWDGSSNSSNTDTNSESEGEN